MDPSWTVFFTVARAGKWWEKALHGSTILRRSIRPQAGDDGAPNLAADRVTARGTASASVRAERTEGTTAGVGDVVPIDMIEDVPVPLRIFYKDILDGFLDLVLQQVLDVFHFSRINGRAWDDVWNGLGGGCICCFPREDTSRQQKQ